MKAQIEKNGEINEMDDDTVDNYNPRTKFYNQENFYDYKFDNLLQFPVANYLAVKTSDKNSVFFNFRDDLLEKNENINLTGIGVTLDSNKSNLTQENLASVAELEQEKYLEANEKLIVSMLPSWGLSDYELSKSSVTSRTSNFGVNYLETYFEFNNKGKKLISCLLLIPKDQNMIRLLTVFFLENEKDMNISMENIRLL